MSAPKFIVWVKDEGRWVEQGDGPLTEKTAERIAREIRHMGPVKVLPVDVDIYTYLESKGKLYD